MDLAWINENFSWIQGGILALLAGIGWIFFRPKDPESRFKVRESDLRRKPSAQKEDLAQARISPTARPLLPGFRFDGQPHEVLGVSPQATTEEIQTAYRELMKRFHPDKIGPVQSPQWKEAQAIAAAINQAKEMMLKRGR